ncbi:MAG: glycoside hydrolase family 38 N-terminal domain-containing protein [Actinomycetota bacterium]
MVAEPLLLHIIPHTHWDREWYEPFEGYRMRLVQVVDSLLEVLEADADFHWHFDGQTAAIEDYLNVRPEQIERVRNLVRSGRLAIGPWRILMDEFLCSGETIIRNVRQGIETANRLGAQPRIGYIPDSFGHIEQMPQILALAGITDALVWRGVPRAVDRPVFMWRSPDGTELRTIYLATSYSNAATLPTNYEDLIVRSKRIIEDMAPLKPPGIVLGMCGSDHLGPQSHLTELFRQANERQSEVVFRIGSLQQYVSELPDEPWPTWLGEMRSSARANLLMGVLSARMPLKQKEFAASTALERYAEPLCVISGFDPGTMLEECWRSLVENSAHDSVCGCGIDEVASTVAARYDKAAFVARAITDASLAKLNDAGPTEESERLLIWNPSPFERSGIAEALVHLPDPTHPVSFTGPDGVARPAQVLGTTDQILVDMTLRGEDLARLVPAIHSRKMGHLYVNDVSVRLEGKSNVVELGLGTIEVGSFDIEGAKRAVEAAIASRPRAMFRVFGKGPPLARVLVQTGAIPGLGLTILKPVLESSASSKLSAGDTFIQNEHLRIEISPEGVRLHDRATGLSFERIGLVDGADAGDEYTWSPPKKDQIFNRPRTFEWSVEQAGPLERKLSVRETWKLPESLDSTRRTRSRRTALLRTETTFSLRCGERFGRVNIEIENSAKDHRLRLHVPLPFTVDGSDADQSFAVVRRGLVAESGPHETGTPTFPSRRWVDVSDGAHGLSIFHVGTPEYEVDADGRGVSITLLRCVGWLSRQDCSTRTGPAGPMLPAPAAQLRGAHSFSLALSPHAGNWSTASVHRIAEEFAYPYATAVTHQDAIAESKLEVSPACIQLAALQINQGRREARIYNASPEEVAARVELAGALESRSAFRVDLLGNRLGELRLANNAVEIKMRPWEIATIRLDH